MNFSQLGSLLQISVERMSYVLGLDMGNIEEEYCNILLNRHFCSVFAQGTYILEYIMSLFSYILQDYFDSIYSDNYLYTYIDFCMSRRLDPYTHISYITGPL